jgi:hypothetical protein
MKHLWTKRHGLSGSLAVLALCALAPQQSYALGFSAFGGGSYGFGSLANDGFNAVSPRFGGDLSFGIIGPLNLGAYYEVNLLGNAAGASQLHFFGGLVRLEFPLGLFVDGKFGAAQVSGNAFHFGFGVALGYKLFTAGPFSLAPRAGYRYLMTTGGGGAQTADLDLALMFSF